MENSKENVHVDIGACNAYTCYRGDHHYHKLPKSKALGRRKKNARNGKRLVHFAKVANVTGNF